MADIRLDGRVAIVTGAARGLGKAMAAGLARAGAAVLCTDLDARALATTVAELKSTSGKLIGVAGDITVAADCARVVDAAVAEFGALHVLVNNAAMGPIHIERAPKTRSLKFWEADPDVWQQVIVTNINGTFLMARHAVPHLLRAASGRIVNVTTSLPTMQRKANSPYGVSKAAIEAETLIWAQDLEGTSITVNSLIPGGAADTDFVHKAARERLIQEGRELLSPQVMVAPIVWLASTLSDGVTGARFVGKLWDARLPPAEAAVRAREAPVLRQPA